MANSFDVNRPKKASFIKVRFLIALMGTLCPVVCYIARQNLSIARNAMVIDAMEPEPIPESDFISSSLNQTDGGDSLANEQASSNAITSTNDTTLPSTIESSIDTCPPPIYLNQDGRIEVEPKTVSYGPRYDWTPSQVSLLFEAFFFTYVLCQIPAARLAETVGAKWILATATIGSTLLSLLTPWAASMSVYAFALIRALMGICQTALYPASYVLYSHWLPPVERSQALPVLSVGAYIGSIITSTATGYFIEQKSFGWEYAFYMPSVVCGLWSVLWIFIGANEPREHKFISIEEIEYIESKMEVKKSADQVKKSPSWRKLFTSQHIWAMMAGFLASNWSFTITLLLIPAYLNSVLHIPPFKNGVINSIIYVLFCISSPVVGAMSALLIESRTCGMKSIHVRKLFECFAIFSQAVCFISLPLIGCDTNMVLGVLYLQIVLFSFVNGGEVQLPSDLSTDFAGTIYAIGNCVGSSTGFLVPRVHSLIVTNLHDKSQWNMYFYVAATISTIGALIFLIFGKNDLQDYSDDDINKPDKPINLQVRIDEKPVFVTPPTTPLETVPEREERRL